jgi:hypothetical protein
LRQFEQKESEERYENKLYGGGGMKENGRGGEFMYDIFDLHL